MDRRRALRTLATVLLAVRGRAGAIAAAAPRAPRVPPDAQRDRWATAPAPRIVMPDVYVVRGAREARVQAWLEMPDGSRPQRAFSMNRWARNGTQVRGFFGDIAGGRTFFPHNGCALEFTIPILQTGANGQFFVDLTHNEDGPSPGGATCSVHVVDALPQGYKPPAPLKVRPAPVPARPAAAPLLRTDFIKDFQVTRDGSATSFAGPTGTGAINDALGIFTTHGVTRSRDGALIDALPIIDGVRHLQVLDRRADPVADTTGRFHDYVMPFLSLRGRLTRPYGFFRLRTAYLRIPGLDDARWRLPVHEVPGRYREHDMNEQTGDKSFPRWLITQHRAVDGARRVQGHAPFLDIPAGTVVTHDVLIEPDRIRTWIDGTLIDETFNLMDPVPMYEIFSIEGWGGSAAGTPIAGFESKQPSKPLILYEAYAL